MTIPGTPEVKEVEPIIWIAANVFFQQPGVALDGNPHRRIPLSRLHS
jgi:hypothetical protein